MPWRPGRLLRNRPRGLEAAQNPPVQLQSSGVAHAAGSFATACSSLPTDDSTRRLRRAGNERGFVCLAPCVLGCQELAAVFATRRDKIADRVSSFIVFPLIWRELTLGLALERKLHAQGVGCKPQDLSVAARRNATPSVRTGGICLGQLFPRFRRGGYHRGREAGAAVSFGGPASLMATNAKEMPLR